MNRKQELKEQIIKGKNMQSAYASGSWISAQACVKLRNSKAKLTTETYYYNCFDNAGGGGGGGGGDNSRFALPIPRIIIKTAAAGGHVKSITSTSNPFVKHCLKLQQNSSYRHSHASALVVGSTPIRWWCDIFIYLFFE